MSVCKMCSKDKQENETVIVNGEKFSGICLDCKNCIEMFHQSNSDISTIACKKIMDRYISDPNISPDIKRLLSIPKGAIIGEEKDKDNHTKPQHNTFSLKEGSFANVGVSKWAGIVDWLCTGIIVVSTIIGVVVGLMAGGLSDSAIGLIAFPLIMGVVAFVISAVCVCVLKMFAEMGKNIAGIARCLNQKDD